MHDKLKVQLDSHINTLINRISKIDSELLLKKITRELIPSEKSPYERGLSSPHNQLFYIAGLVLANPSKNIKEIPPLEKRHLWTETIRLVQKVFWDYVLLFLPESAQEPPQRSPEWYKIREISMSVFLKYYNESILAYNEQLIERLKALFLPFDKVLAQATGLSVSQTLDIIKWFEEKIQRQYDSLFDISEKYKNVSEAFLKKCKQEGWDPKQPPESKEASDLDNQYLDVLTCEHKLFIINLAELEKQFGAKSSQNFLHLFMSELGKKYSFRYITDVNPALILPLIKINYQQAICLFSRQLYVTALMQFENILRHTNSSESFLKNRDKWTETKTRAVIVNYFNDASVFPGIFETKTSHNEHDIIVLANERILIIEVKASPLKEPPDNPVSLFVRVKRAFSGDRGIQKAYEQALHLKNLIVRNKRIQLYDKQGNPSVTINEKDFKNGVYILCVTADNFGALATDLSLLLQKPSDEPYPLAINLFDLETLLWGFKKENKTTDDLYKYFDGRERLHGKIHTLDELDIADYFLKHGDFSEFDKVGKVFLDISFPSIFDKHYGAEHGIDFPYDNNDKEVPYYIEIKRKGSKIITGIKGFPDTYEEIDLAHNPDKTSDVREKTEGDRRKIGRNEPCPCGSSKKYKHCHGRSP